MRETFQIGTKIYFIGLRDGGTMIPEFYKESDGIPTLKLKHGNTTLLKNEGVIVDKHNEFFIIEFWSNGKTTRMGFKRGQFGLLEKPKVKDYSEGIDPYDDMIIIHNPSNQSIKKEPRRDKLVAKEIPMINVKDR